MITKQNFSNGLIFLTVFAIFSCALVVHRLANICYYLLLLIAIVELAIKRDAHQSFWLTLKQYWPLNLAMCSTCIAVLIQQLAHGSFSIRMYDLPSRLGLFALIFWLLLQLPSVIIKKIKWGFICGAIFYLVDLYIDTRGGDIRVGNINSFSIIFSSELALLMGMYSLLSIEWRSRHAIPTLVMQIVAGICGLYSVYLSQTRGAWIAIPFFLFIGVSTLMHAQTLKVKIYTYLAILIIMAAVSGSSSIVQERIDDIKIDLTELTVNKNPDTSIGVRLQLWNASWIMFKAHPIFGVGKENFSAELGALKQRGIITEAAAIQYHSHNEILYGMSTMGIFGLLAILMTYLVPTACFTKYMFHPNAQIHAAAAMGLTLCLGYMTFGLVDVMFGWNMCNVFYCTSIAVLFAFIINKNKELADQPQ
ncbi:O-antigen ligase [Oxalobacteraceae bacterium GrIS 2.11]